MESLERPDSQPFPLDFDSLKKGDVIAAETIEEIYGEPRVSRNYPLRVMHLKGRIEHELRERGYPVTTKGEGDAIRILTDEESVAYNIASYEAGRARMGRSHVRLISVDLEQVSGATRRVQERAVEVEAMQLLAMRKAKRQYNALKPPAKELGA